MGAADEYLCLREQGRVISTAIEEIEMATNHGPAPSFGPLVEVCKAHGISRSLAYELVASGHLETFTIGVKRYVIMDSLRTLPQRLSDAEKAADNGK